MSFDKRFYGIYSAIVADAQDPEELGRVKLIIPQVLGDNITEWCYGTGGVAVSNVGTPYGTFVTRANQTVTAANTETIVSAWYGLDMSRTYVDGTRLYVEETGDYMFVFSAAFTKNGGSLTTADMWLKKNGSSVDESNTRVTITANNAETLMTVSFILDLDKGDYIELAFSSPESSTKLTYYAASTSPTRPSMPGVIASLNLIGKWKAQPGTKAWAMFEAGDPNFPVWMGAV